MNSNNTCDNTCDVKMIMNDIPYIGIGISSEFLSMDTKMHAFLNHIELIWNIGVEYLNTDTMLVIITITDDIEGYIQMVHENKIRKEKMMSHVKKSFITKIKSQNTKFPDVKLQNIKFDPSFIFTINKVACMIHDNINSLGFIKKIADLRYAVLYVRYLFGVPDFCTQLEIWLNNHQDMKSKLLYIYEQIMRIPTDLISYVRIV